METRIKKIMLSVFESDGVTEIPDDASPDTIDGWDSLAHMNMVLALEEEFGVVFTDEEIEEMLNYNLIHEILKNKTA